MPSGYVIFSLIRIIKFLFCSFICSYKYFISYMNYYLSLLHHFSPVRRRSGVKMAVFCNSARYNLQFPRCSGSDRFGW